MANCYGAVLGCERAGASKARTTWPRPFQLKAAEILEKVFAEQPDHPGVAHYLIHSYDYPTLARRALDYQAYGYLQGAQDREARRILDACQALAKEDLEHFASAYASRRFQPAMR